MNRTTDIFSGASFRFAFTGLFVFVAGLSFCFLLLLPGLLITALGIWLIISPSGVQISKEGNKVKKYITFGLFKAGLWKTYLPADGITLDLYTSKGSTRSVAGMQVGWYGTAPGRSYIIQLTGTDHEPIEIKEIMDYPEARKFAEKLAAELDIPFTDHAESLLNKAVANRAARDPRSRRKK